ncbi:hypothetical protein BJX70DRAFT_394547 [Aspergillus crustosus]
MDTKFDYTLDPEGDTVLFLRSPNTLYKHHYPERGTYDNSFGTDQVRVEPPKPQDTPDPVRFLASSKHLTLASPIFKRMLSMLWTEGRELGHNRKVTLETTGWDVDAVRMLLLMIHAQPQKLPSRIDTGQLTKLSIVADYYECRELVTYYANTWFKKLLNTPCHYSFHVVTWIWLGYFFRRPKAFKEYTKIWIRDSATPLDPSYFGLPIPGHIIDALNTVRTHAMSSIVSALHSAREFLSKTSCCTRLCSTVARDRLESEIDGADMSEPTPLLDEVSYALLLPIITLFKHPSADYMPHVYRFRNPSKADEPRRTTEETSGTRAREIVEMDGPDVWEIEGLELEEYLG